MSESPLERIVRESIERDKRIVADPASYTRAEVEAAQLRTFQREHLNVRDVLRYGD